MDTILIIPGLGDSGRDHWQTWLQARLANSLRVVQPGWHKPNLGVWRRTVRQAIRLVRGKVWMVAHSFGSLAAVSAARDHPGRIAGMMLVAPADPRKFDLEHLLPQTQLTCPSVVVASSDDPWLPLPIAALWAERWGSRFRSIAKAGHINVDSGFGPWPEGLEILRALQEAESPLVGDEPLISSCRKNDRLKPQIEQWLATSRQYLSDELVSAGRVGQRERDAILKCDEGDW